MSDFSEREAETGKLDAVSSVSSPEIPAAATHVSARRSIWSMLFGGSPGGSKTKKTLSPDSKGAANDHHISSISCSIATSTESRASSPLFIPQLRGLTGLTFPSVILNRARCDALFPHLPDSLQMQHFTLVYSLPNHGSDLSTLYNKVRAHRGSCANTVLLVRTIGGGSGSGSGSGSVGRAGRTGTGTDTDADTDTDRVFGAFSAAVWRPCNAFYGSGQNFLFSFTSKSKCKSKDTDRDRDRDGDSGTDGDASGAKDCPEENAAQEQEQEQGQVDVDIFRWTGQNTLFQYSSDDKIALGGGGPAGGFGLVLDKDFSVCESCPCNTYGNVSLHTAAVAAGVGVGAAVGVGVGHTAAAGIVSAGASASASADVRIDTGTSAGAGRRAATVANVELWTFQL